METCEKSIQQDFQISTLPVRACRVLHSLSQENDQQIPLIKNQSEVISFTHFAKSLKLKNLGISFLNRSKEFFRLGGGREKYLVKSSQGYQNFGMMQNGKCLTARISGSLKIGKDCSLSDILEDNPDPKYFLLWEKLTRTLASRSQQKPQLLEL